jgi:hypothetical protein
VSIRGAVAAATQPVLRGSFAANEPVASSRRWKPPVALRANAFGRAANWQPALPGMGVARFILPEKRVSPGDAGGLETYSPLRVWRLLLWSISCYHNLLAACFVTRQFSPHALGSRQPDWRGFNV